jgi:hypothetical protein
MRIKVVDENDPKGSVLRCLDKDEPRKRLIAELLRTIRETEQVLNNPVNMEAKAKRDEAIRRLEAALAEEEIESTVCYPNASGFSRFKARVRSVRPGGAITSGPILIRACPKNRCRATTLFSSPFAELWSLIPKKRGQNPRL